MKAKTKKNIFIFLFLLPTLCAFVLFYLYPILTVFFSTFCKWDYTNLTSPEILPLGQLLDNYKYILTTYPYFKEALLNSLKWAACGVFIGMPIAVITAIVISMNLRGSKLVRNAYIIPCVISSAAMGLIFVQLYNPRYGLVMQIVKAINPSFVDNILLVKPANFWAMTLSYILFQGTSSLMLLGQISSVSTDIYDAAKIDGAYGWKREVYITLPCIKDMIKTVTILAASSGFLIYNEVYFLTKGAAGTKSLSYILRELAVGSSRTQYARANVIGVVLIVGGLLIVGVINIVFSVDFKGIFRRIRGISYE